MKLHGRVWKDGKEWLVEVPGLDAMTQGRSKADALAMVVDLVETMVNAQGFTAAVVEVQGENFYLASNQAKTLVALMLRRLRAASGLSLAQVSERLGAKSRTAFARYEQGKAVPTVDMLDGLLLAINPEGGIKLWL